MRTILIVDDEPEMRTAIREALKRKGFGAEEAGDAGEALERLRTASFSMVISDMKMPGRGGLDLLKEIKRIEPSMPVLLITAFGTIEKAVEAVKEGAADFLIKPFSLEALEAAVERAIAEEEGISGFESKGKAFVTRDKPMRKILSMAMTAASSGATVLISGESGTGKELLARFIHQMSPRKDRPFVAINCASIPEGLLESELFGHEKGAFTGAVKERQGKFELSSGGTLLLDEIGEMDQKLQAKILRVIQEKEVERLGAKAPIPLDIRIIATTNRDLRKEVREGRFREDLFYRLNIFPLTLPPLRERKDDIPHLAEYFMKRFSSRYGKHLTGITGEALTHIVERAWRGNIRELENTIERAVLMSQGTMLQLQHLVACNSLEGRSGGPFMMAMVPSETEVDGAPLNISGAQEPLRCVNEKANIMTLSEMEKGLIFKTLGECAGNRTRAARTLGISVRTLRNKLKEYGQLLPG